MRGSGVKKKNRITILTITIHCGGKNSGGKKTPGFLPLFLCILLLPPLSDFS